MSWSLEPITGVAAADVNEAIDKAKVAGVGSPSQEVTEQVEAAKAAAKEMIATGAVGDGNSTFSVQLSGHANQEHQPQEGWANDCIQVGVSQQSHTANDAPAAEGVAEDNTASGAAQASETPPATTA